MNTVSVEIVPCDHDHLIHERDYLANEHRLITTINVPDIARFRLRSWDACAILTQDQHRIIPHLPASRINTCDELPFTRPFLRLGISEVLIVSGDAPNGFGDVTFRTTIFDVLTKIREEMPGTKVYAALDPYRSNIRHELDYAERKLRGGFDGFFTQPFFDLDLMRFYESQLSHVPIYWGIAPVISEGARSYWETRNHVVFPRHFKPTMSWNVGYAREFIVHMRTTGQPCYIMPIRVPLTEYLPKIL